MMVVKEYIEEEMLETKLVKINQPVPEAIMTIRIILMQVDGGRVALYIDVDETH